MGKVCVCVLCGSTCIKYRSQANNYNNTIPRKRYLEIPTNKLIFCMCVCVFDCKWGFFRPRLYLPSIYLPVILFRLNFRYTDKTGFWYQSCLFRLFIQNRCVKGAAFNAPYQFSKALFSCAWKIKGKKALEEESSIFRLKFSLIT